MGLKDRKGSSTLNFPGVLSAVLFFGGCNLRCPYCHNPLLACNSHQLPDMSIEETIDWLKRRRGFDDGVVITGGEPTLAPGLYDLVYQIKALGFQVKLDTNGLRPEVLQELVTNQLLDFVAIDLKTSPSRYGELGGPADSAELLKESFKIIQSEMRNGLDYEVRTTCCPGLVEEGDIHAIGTMMGGCHRWVLQQFSAAKTLNDNFRYLKPYAPKVLKNFAHLAGNYAVEVLIRGL